MNTLIVGLGNPGPRYETTRHNLGFRVIDALAERFGVSWRRIQRGQILTASHRDGRDAITLAKPQTFMNASGTAVAPLVKKLRIKPTHVWIIVDDLDLPFGRLRLRPAGSSGGHHGLDSIITHLGANTFARLRIGIGPKEKPAHFDGAAYVLRPWSAEERKHLPAVITRATEALAHALENGWPQAMAAWNARS